MERHVILGACLVLLAGQLQSAVSQTGVGDADEVVVADGHDTADHVITDGVLPEGEPPDATTQDIRDGRNLDDTGVGYTLGEGQREGHFTNGSRVVVPVTIDLRGYTSLSFRTCHHGTLLSQVGSSGDALSLEVNEEGSLVLTLTGIGQPVITTLGRRFNNNVWHRVYLRFELGVLRLGVDHSTVVVANTTSASEPLLNLGLWSDNPQLNIGGSFVGCILQGAGTEMTNPLAKHTGVAWGHCPFPDGRDCTGYDTDPCFSLPCGRRGQCVANEDGYTCNCYTRYSGENCDIDQGPLCQQPLYECQNGGLCQENRLGNATTCACPTGFTGAVCERTIDASFCENSVNLCQNNATCTVTQFEDRYECLCLPGYSGDHCEMNVDDCASFPCHHDGICSDGINDFTCTCDGTGYEGEMCEENINECNTLQPCLNGATCYDLYGDYECACSPGYGGKHCEVEIHECSSDPCQNGGTCTDLQNAYRCTCLLGFEGDNCEHNINDCYNITCPENSYCMDGVNEYVCRCNPGFSGSPPNCLQINECDSSPCLNGASCYDEDNSFTCICATGFTGSNCEMNIDDCASDPCQNGGMCIDGISTFTCECLPGFIGDYCEENRNECALNVCVHAVNCEDLFGDYVCTCEPGWAGKDCDEDIDECASSPCRNGATCKDKLNGFVCTCPPGYTGETCETDINECDSNPCLNDGLCIDGLNNYTCECDQAYMGVNCEEEYDPCASNRCQNNATCIRRGLEFYCECLSGFEGLYCSNNINDCIDVICSGGKICFDLVDSYECRCPEGFTGENCSVNIDECESSPCLNDGICHDGMANYTCDCPPGYTGHNCEVDVDECETERPCVNGICRNTVGSYQCYCRPGFSGDQCHIDFNECLSQPCQNSGTCINRINGYECVCQPGFTGTDCDIDIDECESAPCQNNATCYDGIANFTCECLPGFTDQLCSTNIDECESEPCLNGGMCTDGINSYTCNCSDTGFKGDQCMINIDDCESSPCQHGSTCSDLVKDYNCACYEGYTGKDCEEDIQECQIGPCYNGAVCLERSNLTLYDLEIFSNFTYENAGGFICECLPGFTGEFCEIDIDECASSPCLNGECNDGINAYSCDCWPGYDGVNCETEINECELYIPCIVGSCVDKVADYECICEEGYGGKNCSVELIGCIGISCQNGGNCEALLFDESVHDFSCHCQHGFTGKYCEEPTTVSFAGNSFIEINSQREEGYDLAFRFRTTLPNGILAVGQGDTYIKLELLQGKLNLHTSLLNKWDGIWAGSNLNDGEWQNVHVSVNDSHVTLAANTEETVHPISHVTSTNSSETSSNTSFSKTFIGGATSTLRILSNTTPFFTGCMEDVELDQEVLTQRTIPQASRALVMDGCPRVEQCHPNPCMNEGECQDLWTEFQCTCKRPYLGETCQLSFTPATFGNEDIMDSLVTVVIPEVDHSTYRTHADVSMLVRTREDNGLIFYLGTRDDTLPVGGIPSHILAELKDGQLVVRTLLDGPEEMFVVSVLPLIDGEPHLLHVKRTTSTLEVYVDNEEVLNTTLESSGNLDAHVLYLGGIPDGSPSRVKRQLGVSNVTISVTRQNFKGTMQDIRLSNGTDTRLVQPFPLQNITDVELPGLDLQEVVKYNVLEGTVSDNNCVPEPCQNGATCGVTWNDFECKCTFGYKGKTCIDREYCAIYKCPSGSECLNLDDGYECIANLTLNGVNSSITYSANFTSQLEPLSDISVTFRSQVGGVMLWAAAGDASFLIGVTPNSVVIEQSNNSFKKETSFVSNSTLDGDWHELLVSFDPMGLQVILDGISLLGSDIAVIIDLSTVILNGELKVGSAPASSFSSLNLVDPSHLVSTASSRNSIFADEYFMPQVFRGCLGIVRVEGVLVPFFSQSELNNSAANQFLQQNEEFTDIGCTVCYEEECLNDGYCADPGEEYSCLCPAGFEGDLCEINIDECLGNECQNGALCIDGINEYTCNCAPGYKGTFCEEDIDECESNPCKNGGICYNEIAQFRCECPEDFIGQTCAELKVKNCSNLMCQNGATCNDIFNYQTNMADNYTCDCVFGYTGYNCEAVDDFCENIDCNNGDCHLTYRDQGWMCECEPGWEGLYCELEVDECALNPCKNGATCLDALNDFSCICTDAWQGPTCENDVDECLRYPCINDGECRNLEGTYECLCTEYFCGQTCSLENPCLEYNCSNDGQCIHLCDEISPELPNQTLAMCRCPEGWGGDFCTEEVILFPSEVDLAIIVGCVVGLMLVIAIVGLTVFLMMAKKKRQTRGTYSPSRQEFYSPRVEMGNMMKPPPEERLI